MDKKKLLSNLASGYQSSQRVYKVRGDLWVSFFNHRNIGLWKTTLRQLSNSCKAHLEAVVTVTCFGCHQCLSQWSYDQSMFWSSWSCYTCLVGSPKCCLETKDDRNETICGRKNVTAKSVTLYADSCLCTTDLWYVDPTTTTSVNSNSTTRTLVSTSVALSNHDDKSFFPCFKPIFCLWKKGENWIFDLRALVFVFIYQTLSCTCFFNCY